MKRVFEISQRILSILLDPPSVDRARLTHAVAVELAAIHERIDKLEDPKFVPLSDVVPVGVEQLGREASSVEPMEPPRVEFDSLVFKPDGTPKDLGFQSADKTSYESPFRPERGSEERIRTAVADLRRLIDKSLLSPRDTTAAHEYLDFILTNLKKLEPQCGVDRCEKPATKPDPYGGADVCEVHYDEFDKEQSS